MAENPQAAAEKTLIIIKPEAVGFAELIFNDLDQYAERIATSYVSAVPKELIEEHYSIHKDKFFFERLTRQFTDKPVVLAVYKGENVIQKMIELSGATDPANALPGTIRGKYARDTIDQAMKEERAVRNIIHRSDSTAEFEREFEVWKGFF